MRLKITFTINIYISLEMQLRNEKKSNIIEQLGLRFFQALENLNWFCPLA